MMNGYNEILVDICNSNSIIYYLIMLQVGKSQVSTETRTECFCGTVPATRGCYVSIWNLGYM